MRICSAPMPRDDVFRLQGDGSPTRRAAERRGVRAGAFTLIELILVMTMLSLMILLVQTNLFGVLRRQSFKSQVQDFVSTMQMAASSAAENGRRYEVILDPTGQSYLLREITSADLSHVREEEIITEGRFGSNCRLSRIEFDDGDYTNNERSKFRVGPAGWTYGGKVVFLDESEQPYAVVVNRLTPIIEVVVGDPPLMTPKAKDEVSFP